MSDSRFSFLISLIFFVPLLVNPGVLIMLPIIILYPSSIDNTFVTFTIILFLLFATSLIMLLVTFRLARKRKKITNYLVYIFALPIIYLIYIFILGVYTTSNSLLKAGTSDGGEGLLGALIGTVYFLIGFLIFGLYFTLIRKRIKRYFSNG